MTLPPHPSGKKYYSVEPKQQKRQAEEQQRTEKLVIVAVLVGVTLAVGAVNPPLAAVLFIVTVIILRATGVIPSAKSRR